MNVIKAIRDFAALLRDGSKAMTGNLDLGSNDITNCPQIGVSGDNDLLGLASEQVTVNGGVESVLTTTSTSPVVLVSSGLTVSPSGPSTTVYKGMSFSSVYTSSNDLTGSGKIIGAGGIVGVSVASGNVITANGIEAAAFVFNYTGTITTLRTIFADSPSINLGTPTITTAYGLYVADQDDAAITTAWQIYSETGNSFFGDDNSKSFYGTGKDASVYYDGTDLVIDTAEVGTGVLKFANTTNWTANATNTVTISNVAPAGVGTATISKWFTVKDDAGTVFYIPAWT